MDNKKYKILTDEENTLIVDNVRHAKLHRIKALKDIYGNNNRPVKAGDIGGYVENESNLSQSGDCWIYDNAMVYSDAKVYENAAVYDRAIVADRAEIFGNAKIKSKSRICGNIKIYGYAFIDINTDTEHIYSYDYFNEQDKYIEIYDNAKIYGGRIRGNAKIYGNATIYDGCIGFNSEIFGNAVVNGRNTYIGKNAKIYENSKIKCGFFEAAQIHGNAVIAHYIHFCKNADIFLNTDYAVINIGDSCGEAKIMLFKTNKSIKIVFYNETIKAILKPGPELLNEFKKIAFLYDNIHEQNIENLIDVINCTINYINNSRKIYRENLKKAKNN